MNKSTRWRKLWRWLYPSETVTGPMYQNPIAEPVINIIPPYQPNVWKRIVSAGKPLIRDEEKIAKAEAKRERKRKRGW